jgi:hypothetical protein
LLTQIDELEKAHKSQIEELNIIYNRKIKELEDLIILVTKSEAFELRVYKHNDINRIFYIKNAEDAKEYYYAYVRHYAYWIPVEVVVFRDTDNHLQRVIEESEYVDADVDKIRNDMARDKIAYNTYWDGDYIINWFVIWLF